MNSSFCSVFCYRKLTNEKLRIYIKENRLKHLRKYLFEMLVAKFDKGCCLELPRVGHDQRARAHFVEVGHDQHQVRGLFDWKETGPWNVDTNRVAKVFDSRTGRSLQLDHIGS